MNICTWESQKATNKYDKSSGNSYTRIEIYFDLARPTKP